LSYYKEKSGFLSEYSFKSRDTIIHASKEIIEKNEITTVQSFDNLSFFRRSPITSFQIYIEESKMQQLEIKLNAISKMEFYIHYQTLRGAEPRYVQVRIPPIYHKSPRG